jgi:hypothetical protein
MRFISRGHQLFGVVLYHAPPRGLYAGQSGSAGQRAPSIDSDLLIGIESPVAPMIGALCEGAFRIEPEREWAG